MIKKLSILWAAAFLCADAFASIKDYTPPIAGKQWTAFWSDDGSGDMYGYKILQFRRTFDLPEVPAGFKINISADNRYKLYVNGKELAKGPERGDLYNWYYETIDISPALRKGRNVIAVLVWNAGKFAPVAQISKRTGLIVDGATPAEDFIATSKDWKVKASAAYEPITDVGWFYTGFGERVDGAKLDWGWTLPNFDDSKWGKAAGFDRGKTLDDMYGTVSVVLKPRNIPAMEEYPVRLRQIRRAEGLGVIPNFIDGNSPLTIPAKTKCKILIDNGVLTNAYPVLLAGGGKGSRITVRYGEALFKNGQKANRDEIEGRDFAEKSIMTDEFLPDGGDKREFTTLWFRTYRYVGFEIETKDEPLVIRDFYGIFTGYPFKEAGSFVSDDKNIGKIWDVGWRTARLCAMETYFDCPYYEQLQYVGDTRIQALISYYVAGDARLAKQAVNMFDASRTYFGITKSRYPSEKEQYIAPFSLYWVSMVNDYALHADDAAFVKGMLAGVRTVLSWYSEQLDPEKNMLKPRVPFWNFVDWSSSGGPSKTRGEKSYEKWNRGIPPEGENEGTAITTLHLAYTLRQAAELMREMGETADAEKYVAQHDAIVKAVRQRCWNSERKIFMDFAGAATSSQHVNIMAILSDAIPAAEQPALMEKILTDKELVQCTFYYRFYLTEALRKTGMADRYVSELKPWYDMIDIGLTTFAENPEPTRSDCHAWSSSPNYHLLSLVCGVMPDGYGFKRVKISPHFGTLGEIRAAVPHPKGKISVSLKRDGNAVRGAIVLPDGLEGKFEWNAKTIPLRGGENLIDSN